MLADLGLPLEVTRQLLFWFDPKDGIEAFIRPTRDQKAGSRSRSSGPADPETIDGEVHHEEVEFIRSYLARYVPDLDGDFLYAKTCMYTNTS